MATSNSCVLRAGVLVCGFAMAFPVVAQEDIGVIKDRMIRLETSMEIIQKEIQYETLRRQQEQQRSDTEQMVAGVLPYVVSIAKLDERWIVRLQHDNGVINAYGVGDLITPMVRVSDISDRGVTVKKSMPSTQAKAASKKASDKGVVAEPQYQLIALKLLPLQGQGPGMMPRPGVASPMLNTPLPPPIPYMGR